MQDFKPCNNAACFYEIYLTNSLFPIVANPDESFSTFILDTRYWSDELIANFIHG
mgnify:CR=1 FL=1